MDRRKFILLGSSLLATPALANVKTYKDVFIPKSYRTSLDMLHYRLEKIEHTIGYANFNIISFDKIIHIAKQYSKIGAFTKKELELVEYFFYSPAEKFGFLGDRTVDKLTNKINKKEIIKVKHTGHFVFKGESLKIYDKMIKDVDDIYLTSGIRNVPKQLRLFVRKIKHSNYNISKACFSIAPPAYSYHSVSDFDVGKRGWGYKNFTSSFAKTKEFFEIRHLNYVGIRYRRDNHYGVRFEPWHIKVI